MSDGCATPVGGFSLDGVDISTKTIISGVVTHDGAPVDRAYVQLLNPDGEFVAEVVTTSQGEYRFFAQPGDWTVSVLHRLGRDRKTVAATQGRITEARLAPTK